MSETPQQEPVADLMRTQMQRRGISTKEMADMLDRDPAMVRKVLSGKTSGEAYRHAIEELAAHGNIRNPPPRRRGKDGRMIAVRSKGGGTHIPRERVRPEEIITPLPGGKRQYTYRMPRTRGTKGRGAIDKQIRTRLLNAAKGQGRGGPKRVALRLTYTAGHGDEAKTSSIHLGQKGGYSLSGLRKLVKDYDGRAGGQIMDWMKTQTPKEPGRSPIIDLNKAGTVVTQIEVTIY